MRIATAFTLCLPLLAAAPAHADSSWDAVKDVAKQQAQTKMETTLGLPNPSAPGAKVYIIEPKDGAAVSSPVKVVFGLSGMGVAPAGTQVENTGHHHLLVDNPEVVMSQPLPANDQIKHFGKGQTETMLDLKPGKHTLQLLFADWKHQPHNPALMSDKVTITVK